MVPHWTRTDIAGPEELRPLLLAESLDHQCYVTACVTFKKVRVYLHKGKPQGQTPDAEWTYRTYGCWFHKGWLVQPSASWLDRFNFVPYMG